MSIISRITPQLAWLPGPSWPSTTPLNTGMLCKWVLACEPSNHLWNPLAKITLQDLNDHHKVRQSGHWSLHCCLPCRMTCKYSTTLTFKKLPETHKHSNDVVSIPYLSGKIDNNSLFRLSLFYMWDSSQLKHKKFLFSVWICSSPTVPQTRSKRKHATNDYKSPKTHRIQGTCSQ